MNSATTNGSGKLPVPRHDLEGASAGPGLTDREILEHIAARLDEIGDLVNAARPALESLAAFDPAQAPGWMKMLMPGLGK